MEIVGKIKEIKEVKVVSENFKCQKCILDLSVYDRYTGELQENFAEIQVNNKNVDELANFKVGEMVKVKFYVNGRYSVNETTGQELFFQNLICWKIEKK
jgi:hypothetical protein